MRPLFRIMTATLILAACSPKTASKIVPSKATEWVTWDKKLIDLGKVKKGESRSGFYELTNTTADTVQVDIIDHCDCTEADYPRGPIPPSEKRRVDFTFHSAEKDSSETIEIRLIWKQKDRYGNPRIDALTYRFELLK